MLDLLAWRNGKITDPAHIPALVEPLMRSLTFSRRCHGELVSKATVADDAAHPT
jgi:hypothetical protein